MGTRKKPQIQYTLPSLTPWVLRCIAEGVATRDGVCAYDSFCKSKFLKNKGAVIYARRPTGCVWDSQFLVPKSKRVAFHAEVLQATARRCAAACGA